MKDFPNNGRRKANPVSAHVNHTHLVNSEFFQQGLGHIQPMN